ncbi:MAG TPA: hypothetical protein PLJ65_05935, partial [Casimicrobium sp.]|nr:hypothetical protein [Casimicrobium sp.]
MIQMSLRKALIAVCVVACSPLAFAQSSSDLFKFIDIDRPAEVRGQLLKGVKADSVDERGDHALV